MMAVLAEIYMPIPHRHVARLIPWSIRTNLHRRSKSGVSLAMGSCAGKGPHLYRILTEAPVGLMDAPVEKEASLLGFRAGHLSIVPGSALLMGK